MIKPHLELEESSWEDLHVSYEKLQDYLLTINETNDVYTNSAFAKQVGFIDIPLPSTYAALFWQKFSLPWLSDQSSLILTEQKFNFYEPFTINQKYRGQITLEKLRSRLNKQWATHNLKIYREEKLVATVQTTLVITGDLNE